MATQTLSFYTTGEAMTNLVRNFIQEGSFETAFNILKDGGLPIEGIKEVFDHKLKFIGDTRVGDHTLSLIKETKPHEDLNKMLYYAVKTLLSPDQIHISEILHIPSKFKNSKKNIKVLFDIYGKDEVMKRLIPQILSSYGFTIETTPIEKDEWSFNGAILKDGTVIRCGVQEHNLLYPILYLLGLADASDWIHEQTTIHITDGQMSGDVARAIRYSFRGDRAKVTNEQIQTLFRYRNILRGQYGEDETITGCLLNYISECEKHGGKFNNLTFLKKFYPEINLPKFSKTKLKNVKKQCIRTSPYFSLPGLLNSKFEINKNSIKEIKADFEKYKDVIKGNELHYFYQEYLEGQNGVCHCYDDNTFTYDLSEDRGSIVAGIKGNKTLNAKLLNELKTIAQRLQKDLKKSIQIEFVIHNNELYVVQLRLLKNDPEKTVGIPKPDSNNIIATGITFSKGVIKTNIKDVLIVDSDTDSKELLNKKALIVRNNVDFSHVLALSKALEIPSIYAIGDVVLPKNGTIKIIAFNKEAYITLK